MDRLPEPFNMVEIMAKAVEKTPYVVVAFQECERMNILTSEIRRSLKELNLGLKVTAYYILLLVLSSIRQLSAIQRVYWSRKKMSGKLFCGNISDRVSVGEQKCPSAEFNPFCNTKLVFCFSSLANYPDPSPHWFTPRPSHPSSFSCFPLPFIPSASCFPSSLLFAVLIGRLYVYWIFLWMRGNDYRDSTLGKFNQSSINIPPSLLGSLFCSWVCMLIYRTRLPLTHREAGKSAGVGNFNWQGRDYTELNLYILDLLFLWEWIILNSE